MTTLREAAQQALEALEGWRDEAPSEWTTRDEKIITALRAALAQQPQTPCDIAEDGVCEVIDCCRNPAQQEPATRAQRMRDAGYTRRPTLREMTEQEKGPK